MLNPITYTEKVTRDFLRYQSTTHRFADPDLNDQMRGLLSLEQTRETPLMKGPYVSLSKLFRRGATIGELVNEGVFHPELGERIPFDRLYAHQERGVRSIVDGRPTLVSTGTGSGKTESFLYPIISRCLELRDQGADAGITAVLIYPMNALAQDQLERIRGLLAGTGVSFGLYVGKTPKSASDAEGRILPQGSTRGDYLEAARDSDGPVMPPEERVSREQMRRAGEQPRILLTNVKQLEFLLTRERDERLFDGARLEHLVLDEAHTFSGAMGGETACLIRRLRAYCECNPEDTVCVATSATIADPEDGEEDAQTFVSRLFGVDGEQVTFVSEAYEDESWTKERETPAGVESPPPEPLKLLDRILDCLRTLDDAKEEQEGASNAATREIQNLESFIRTLTGRDLDEARWRESLFDILSSNEFVYQISNHLKAPKPLDTLAEELSEHVGRPIHRAEVLVWLALGAAARRDDRPLLRPVVHGFVRGVDGAVVTFPKDHNGPKLWLSAEDAAEANESLFRFRATTCTRCGQHYYRHHVGSFEFAGDKPGKGQAQGHRRYWEPTSENEGDRLVFVDSLAFAKTGDMEQDPTEMTDKVAPVYLCRTCGTMHSHRGRGCAGCVSDDELLEVYAVQQKAKRPGKLSTCIACNATGRTHHGEFREPARPVRAVTVADVHVVAQSMLQHAERERLLVFTDNRQDAAFQAGWMQDHARRFRLRSLMYRELSDGPISPGDLAYRLDANLADDDDLSKALLPEVWRVAHKASSSESHAGERRKFLRIQVLREIATGVRQQLGLESWGRMRVDYEGLEEGAFFEDWAGRFNCSADDLREGVALWLDVTRRAKILYDSEYGIFSKYLSDDVREVRRGYIPEIQGGPKGLKLKREAGDDKDRVRQIVSSTGHETLATQLVRKWGLDEAAYETFWKELWEFLKDDAGLLRRVTMTWPGGNAIPGCQGVYQIDADRLELVTNTGLYRCPKCRRGYTRRTPNDTCPGWYCDGELEFEPERSDEDYNLMLLDEDFGMVRPSEHSAQVPNERRERIEQAFKGSGNRVNTLVSTPTLELGVDIGSLDSVLMRNVPPLPANYWQRVGRAGRRHRMAVNVTYARPVTHDRAYFDEPLKMLDGSIEPPSFNLKNEVMVRKHVHATVIGHLYQLANRESAGSDSERNQIRHVLSQMLPTFVRHYLFEDDNRIRQESFDLTPLGDLVQQYRDELVEHVGDVFAQHWPERARLLVERKCIEEYIDEMTDQLETVIGRLEERVEWALGQIRRLGRIKDEKGALQSREKRLEERCERLIRRLRGDGSRRGEAEGYDDTYTYSVLAAEGFLPGYGLDTGGVTARHLDSRAPGGQRDWTVRRPLSLAVREFIPGNMIYANGNRYAPRYFQLRAAESISFQVDVDNEAVREESDVGNDDNAMAVSMAESELDAVPICDVELPHSSSISDEEDYRFQLPSAVYGQERDRHGAGRLFEWGRKTIDVRDAVRLRLVNVGPSKLVNNRDLGFPVCRTCGGSRSPFSSDSQLNDFYDWHEERCGQRPEPIGFFADIVADTLRVTNCRDRTEGYSVVEALRHGAARVLEMELEDLQILSLGHTGSDIVDMALYDPMPGGTGLLEQIIDRWHEVWEAALDIVESCPSECERVCVDCLMTFRNMYYHRHLDRHEAAERLREWGSTLNFDEEIDAYLPREEEDETREGTIDPAAFFAALLEELGFPTPERDVEIDVGGAQGTTQPDFGFPDQGHSGLWVYLDEQVDDAEQTRRLILQGQGANTVEVSPERVADREAVSNYLSGLAFQLGEPELATHLQESEGWFQAAEKRVMAQESDETAEAPANDIAPDSG